MGTVRRMGKYKETSEELFSMISELQLLTAVQFF